MSLRLTATYQRQDFPNGRKSKMPRFKDITGQKFGNLVVVSRLANWKQNVMWLCRCECGNQVSKRGTSLRFGTTSCGCKRIGLLAARSRTHGQCGSLTYRTWNHMKQRCLNPTHERYSAWGGRGITVCDRWLSFENFLADMGERPAGMSIERINNDGNYEPTNCKWATNAEQAANKRKRGPYRQIPCPICSEDVSISGCTQWQHARMHVRQGGETA